MQAPKARQVPHLHEIHGDVREDPFHWMNRREDPEVISYLDQENAYTAEVMAGQAHLKQELFDEIKARFPADDRSAPFRMGGFLYYADYLEGNEYPIWRRSASMDVPGETLLDIQALSEGHSYYHVAAFRISPDGRFLAFAEDTLSRRQYDLRVKDLRSGEIGPVIIRNTSAAFAWTADSEGLVYARRDETLRPSAALLHRLDQAGDDLLLYEESDNTYYIDVYPSKSKDYIFIASYATMSSEIRILDAHLPGASPRVMEVRTRGHEYYADEGDGFLFIRSNLHAKNFRLMKAPIEARNANDWMEFHPHSDDVLLEGFEVSRGFIALYLRERGLPLIRMTDHQGRFLRDIPADEESYTLTGGRNEDYGLDRFQYIYSSLVTPPKTMEIGPMDKEPTLVKQDLVLGGFDPSSYLTRRLEATAPDGTRVPITLVQRKANEGGDVRPGLLYGYGSYGIIVEPYFRAHVLSLLDRGFSFAIAHIRGGEDLGRHWYEDGKLLRKMNTFTDFIACAEHLVAEGHVSDGHLHAMGGSAGGLLMGAVMNMRPDLFRSLVAAVPFVDVLTTMLDESIPLTTGEYDEWGDPRIPGFYHYMKRYSPYDNVRRERYPGLLVTAGLHDSQVQYWEPAKWVARIREMNLGEEPVLLHTNMDYGHSGAAGRFERYKDIALEYAFLLMMEGTD